MQSIATIFGLAIAATAVVSAPVNVERGAPSGWAWGYLEPYTTYHTRYLALDCQDQHNTTFFEDCCHPLLSNETLAGRPDYCTPNATQIAAGAAYESATAGSSAVADASSEWVAASTAAASSTAVLGAADFAHKTSTSTYVAPTTTAAYVAPTTTSTYVAPTTTKTTAQATTTASSGGSGSTMTGGYATYFYQGGNAGECGSVHSDSEYGIAIDSNGWWSDYASNANSPYCGKQIVITNSNNGKSVTATVWDVCPTCVSNNSLDLSVAAFNAIASSGDGMVPITWKWA